MIIITHLNGGEINFYSLKFHPMKKILIAAIILLPQWGVAHPGHGDVAGSGYELNHYLNTPFHLATIATILAVAVFCGFLARGRRSKKTHLHA